MGRESADPTVIRSIAVKTGEVAAALETTETSPHEAVLRVTPPFAPRMRARLHIVQTDGYDQEPQPIHIDPTQLVTPAAPAYPRPADTEDELRAEPDRSYSIDRHREYHQAVVDEWREQIANEIRDRIELATPAGSHQVAITVLEANL